MTVHAFPLPADLAAAEVTRLAHLAITGRDATTGALRLAHPSLTPEEAVQAFDDVIEAERRYSLLSNGEVHWSQFYDHATVGTRWPHTGACEKALEEAAAARDWLLHGRRP